MVHCSQTDKALGDSLEAEGSSIIKTHRFNLTRSEEVTTMVCIRMLEGHIRHGLVDVKLIV